MAAASSAFWTFWVFPMSENRAFAARFFGFIPS
jgi:hypothetical protein